MANLTRVIFDQFIEIVERIAKKTGCKTSICGFDFRVRSSVGHQLIDVAYSVEDECSRRRDVVSTIDYTNICYSDLTSNDWISYLNKLAAKFVSEICPKRVTIVKEEPRGCRQTPACWAAPRCSNVTIVTRVKPITPKQPECEVVIERECECIPICRRESCTPPKKVIIRYVNEQQPFVCGDCTTLVREPNTAQHGFSQHAGSSDFNNHQWRPCCASC